MSRFREGPFSIWSIWMFFLPCQVQDGWSKVQVVFKKFLASPFFRECWIMVQCGGKYISWKESWNFDSQVRFFDHLTLCLNFSTFSREFSLIGLGLIALGTGGIKPCVASFGGDQFKLPEQEAQLKVGSKTLESHFIIS